MGSFIDARTVPSGTVLETDLCIIGGGPSGICLALALAKTNLHVVLLESGGMEFDAKTQALYQGDTSGAPYLTLEASRLRFLGGSSNHWGGWCRPLDAIDFEKRDWLAHSGWPITKADVDRYFVKAHSLCEAGTLLYDRAADFTQDPILKLAEGGVRTRFFQFSKMRDSVFPTHFGERYAPDLKKVAKLSVYLNANVTRLGLDKSGAKIAEIDVATLTGKHFKVKPRAAVLATGAIESARLLLASNDVRPSGVGNSTDMVGRFFADHPTPRDTATLVVFDGKLSPYYGAIQTIKGAIVRGGFFPSEAYRRKHKVMASSATVESKAELDALGKAAVAETARALGVDASDAVAYSLGCGMEVTPDPDRRLTLEAARDALGLPKIKLTMKIADEDFEQYRATLAELGRQLLAARTGMIRLNLSSRSEWLANLDWGNHHMGTTRMSANPKTGVVDANLKVHDVANLYVAGSSVFPTYGAANPTINLLALVLRLADHLKGALA
ncbi:choline dehydrogenase-like flavoprotein [Rhizomicrobium palustre]|uniref:Choline dehydrogenase-like flavoprotein n=1 Tax=Rhizomicrobium palustre TaxID=189966 RepID=A0A846MTX8_9PROT|nr:GMC family oxidoreductase [Rhizomicrobium palustre]NIK86685.1 choline dehydrogenase-like flavoprotein [Rhizomicrobium palustre]